MSIIVYTETANGQYKKAALEALSYAKSMASTTGQDVTAIAINATQSSDVLYQHGANKVLKINHPVLEKFSAFAYAKALQSVEADCYILPSTNDSATIAPILSVQTKASLVTNVLESPISTSPLQVKRKAFSGKGIETVQSSSNKNVITVLQNAFGLKENPVAGTEEDWNVDVDESMVKVKVEQEELKTSDKIDLKEAEIVVSAGRGLKGPENWGMIEELAALLGAATACSKPVSDIGWRSHSEHVGQTGKAISPNLYIAIGISGAIQHLAGVNSSKNIVVINTDPEAPFFKSADYGIVGDAFDVVPKLIEELKKLKLN